MLHLIIFEKHSHGQPDIAFPLATTDNNTHGRARPRTYGTYVVDDVMDYDDVTWTMMTSWTTQPWQKEPLNTPLNPDRPY